MMASSDPAFAIQAQGLSFTYPGRTCPALVDLQLAISPGQFVAILGGNGSGKSTLARLMAGLLYPFEGSLSILGIDLSKPDAADALRGRIGLAFQSPDQQMVATTVEREIAFGPENLGLPYEVIRERVQTMLHQFRLKALVHRAPHKLSGGEKQRLALAAVLAMQPAFLILDEITSLLDPCDREEILSHIRRLSRTCTIVMVTQFAEEALGCDRVIFLERGSLALDGRPRDIFEAAESDEVFGVELPLAYRLLRLSKSSIWR
jgi:energy-coupling factor transport system ATP-binding protein